MLQAHEAAILELADNGEVDLAYAVLRICSDTLDRCLSADGGGSGAVEGRITSRSGDIERRITTLSTMRRSNAGRNNAGGSSLLPSGYYGPENDKAKLRKHISKQLQKHVPELPKGRLACLLQQSVKWQCHTGAYPTVARLLHEDGADDEALDLEDGVKQNKRRKRHADMRFDLLLGNVVVDKKKSKRGSSETVAERIPSKAYQTIKLGKNCFVESACFHPDGMGLVTGSSDGFIEVWGEPKKRSKSSEGGNDDDKLASPPALPKPNEVIFEKLRTSDLPYQKNDELMSHDAAVLALAVSRDGTMLASACANGTISVWKLETGRLLRKIERAHGGSSVKDGAAVTCLEFSPDSSKVLSGGHDSTVREHGLLSSKMLKQFVGHTSYVNCASYVTLPDFISNDDEADAVDDPLSKDRDQFLAVVSASADGTVRMYHGRTAEAIRSINPPVAGLSSAGLVRESNSVVRSTSVHTVLHLHAPPQTMIVVPRASKAFLMSYTGSILRVYARDDVQNGNFLAGGVSRSNRYLFLACDDGKCAVFDVMSGSVERIVNSFGKECTTSSVGGGESDSATTRRAEISGMIIHPQCGYIGGYSNDRGQKKGILTLFK